MGRTAGVREGGQAGWDGQTEGSMGRTAGVREGGQAGRKKDPHENC